MRERLRNVDCAQPPLAPPHKKWARHLCNCANLNESFWSCRLNLRFYYTSIMCMPQRVLLRRLVTSTKPQCALLTKCGLTGLRGRTYKSMAHVMQSMTRAQPLLWALSTVQTRDAGQIGEERSALGRLRLWASPQPVALLESQRLWLSSR